MANLFEPDGSGLFTETLTAQVKTIFSDETSLMGTQTAEKARKKLVSEQDRRLSYHSREPFPYLLGRENQTASCVMVRINREVAVEELSKTERYAIVGKAYVRLYSSTLCTLRSSASGVGEELDRRRFG